MAMNHSLDVLLSTAASTLRGWRGLRGSTVVEPPAQPLVLFEREDGLESRLVREALTELNLDADIFPCPLDGERFLPALQQASGGVRIPFLQDPNNGEQHVGADAIVGYLFRRYDGGRVPRALRPSLANMALSGLATAARLRGRLHAKPSRPAGQALTLYSFESSPFSRLVRERLCELELPYHLVNLGKQQWADMGPARFRFSLGQYTPLPDTKRDAFLQRHGRVQVPFLIDPNTDTEMFESADIVAYLDRRYAA